MKRRRSSLLLATSALSALASLGACRQLVGIEDRPLGSSDASARKDDASARGFSRVVR